jgi:hypothetical protein
VFFSGNQGCVLTLSASLAHARRAMISLGNLCAGSAIWRAPQRSNFVHHRPIRFHISLVFGRPKKRPGQLRRNLSKAA